MSELFVVKASQKSLLILPESEEDFAKVGEGEILRVEYRRPRNIRFHRKYFALLRVAFQNQDYYATEQQFRTALLIGLGWCDTFIRQNGEVLYIPKSLSFAGMDEDEFEKVYNDTLDYLVREMVPGADPRALNNAALQILGFT